MPKSPANAPKQGLSLGKITFAVVTVLIAISVLYVGRGITIADTPSTNDIKISVSSIEKPKRQLLPEAFDPVPLPHEAPLLQKLRQMREMEVIGAKPTAQEYLTLFGDGLAARVLHAAPKSSQHTTFRSFAKTLVRETVNNYLLPSVTSFGENFTRNEVMQLVEGQASGVYSQWYAGVTHYRHKVLLQHTDHKKREKRGLGEREARAYKNLLDGVSSLAKHETRGLASEKALVESLAYLQAEYTQAGSKCSAHFCVLRDVLEYLRVHEIGYEYDRSSSVSDEIQALSEQTEYSVSNFMYGSTFFASFLSMLDCSTVAQAFGSDGKLLVLGSSDGWIVFYAALAAQIQTAGYDLMGGRVNVSLSVLQDSDIFPTKYAGLVSFEQKDALKVALDGHQVVYITSKGWDTVLVDALHQKLKAEAAPGTLFIANDFMEKASEHLKQHFVLLHDLEIPVSWEQKQSFFIYRLREPSETDTAEEEDEECEGFMPFAAVDDKYDHAFTVFPAELANVFERSITSQHLLQQLLPRSVMDKVHDEMPDILAAIERFSTEFLSPLEPAAMRHEWQRFGEEH